MKQYTPPTLTIIQLRQSTRVCTFTSNLNDEEAGFQGIRARNSFTDEDEDW